MKPLLIALSVILGLSTISSAQVNEKLLLNKWVDSREEQTNVKGEQIYRPFNFKDFPPSRFRQVFEFKKNGECSYLYLHPTDRHTMEPGTWTFNPDKNLITIKDAKGKETYLITVIELEKDKLVMIRN
ncbi:MAG: hypothetical protein JKY42_10110 [Flavobacteriales bacterium]|nr:hypothetical protein [Flavobacteriales bacterium]